MKSDIKEGVQSDGMISGFPLSVFETLHRQSLATPHAFLWIRHTPQSSIKFDACIVVPIIGSSLPRRMHFSAFDTDDQSR